MKDILSQLIQKTGYQISKITEKSKNPKNNYFQIKKFLSKNKESLIFDVGAHIGDVSKLYRKILPTSTIYAFEPIDECYNKMNAQFNNDSKFYSYKYAITNHVGTKDLFISNNLASSSLLESSPKGIKAWGKDLLKTNSIVTVECTTLDNFCSNNQINNIDLLKLDIQGSEYDALLGAKNLLTNQLISIIYCEIPIFKSYKNQGEFDQILTLLNKHNYHLFNIFKSVINSKNGQLMEIDAMFVLPRMIESFSTDI